jgi:molybdopterin-guanine dinucleotide biosynthesis protein A
LRGALVLAGGKSTRFGRNKALVKLAGRPLVLHILEAAMEIADEVALAIGREDHTTSYSRIVPDSVSVFKDQMREKSPLVGIVRGFQAMKSEYSLVLSCDTPFAKRAVLEFLFEKANGSDAAVPKWPNGDIEPLQSVYQVKPSLLAAKLALSENRFRNLHMIELLGKVVYVPVRDLRQLDKELITFFNVNTKADLRRAEALYDSNFRKRFVPLHNSPL